MLLQAMRRFAEWRKHELRFLQMTETSTTYNFDLRNEEHLASNAIISRDFKLIVQFSCVFQMEYNVSSDSPITTIKQ